MVSGYTKSGYSVPLSGEPDSDQARSKRTPAKILLIEPLRFQSNDDIDAIITAASPTTRFYDESGETSDQIASEALNDVWQEWEDAGKDIVVIGKCRILRCQWANVR